MLFDLLTLKISHNEKVKPSRKMLEFILTWIKSKVWYFINDFESAKKLCLYADVFDILIMFAISFKEKREYD